MEFGRSGAQVEAALGPAITKTADLTIQITVAVAYFMSLLSFGGLATDETRHDRNLDQSTKGFDS